jgi:hypothetical protein
LSRAVRFSSAHLFLACGHRAIAIPNWFHTVAFTRIGSDWVGSNRMGWERCGRSHGWNTVESNPFALPPSPNRQSSFVAFHRRAQSIAIFSIVSSEVCLFPAAEATPISTSRPSRRSRGTPRLHPRHPRPST